MTIIFDSKDKAAIRKFVQQSGERLHKVFISAEGLFRLSSIYRRSHSHLVTVDVVDGDDLWLQAKRYRKTIRTLEEMIEEMEVYAYEGRSEEGIKKSQEIARILDEKLRKPMRELFEGPATLQ